MPLHCDQIRNEFSALLDDELNSEDKELVEEHLSECSDCLRELHGYKQVSDIYFYHHPVKAPEDFEARLQQALSPPAKLHPFLARPVWRFAAAAVILLTTGLAIWQASRRGNEALHLAKFESGVESAATESAPAEEAMQTYFAAPADNAPAPDGIEADDQSAADHPTGGAATRYEDGSMGNAAAVRDQGLESPVDAMASSPSRRQSQAEGPVSDAMPVIQADTPAPAPPQPARVATDADAPVGDRTVPAPMQERVEAAPVEVPAVVAKEAPPVQKNAGAPMAKAEVPVRWRNLEFSLRNDSLTQTTYADETLRNIVVPSDAWTNLRDAHPDLDALFDGSQKVIVQLDETWYRIAPNEVAP